MRIIIDIIKKGILFLSIIISVLIWTFGFAITIIIITNARTFSAIHWAAFGVLGIFSLYTMMKYLNKKNNRWRSHMSFSEPENGIKVRKKSHHDMVSVKVTIIIILIALLMIPGSFIEDMVKERETTKNQAFNETAEKWGRSQSVNGPILYVPVEYETYTKHLRILPEELHINGEIIPEVRYKSIYEILLYRSNLNISGNFLLTEDDEYPTAGKIKWEEAYLAVGFSSMKSIKEVVDMLFGKENIKLEQGLCKKDIYEYGLSSKIKIDHEPGMIIPFSYNLKLDGSCSLLFTPLGKETSVDLRSEWADPNFTGNFLPNERAISDSGFVAKWNVMHLNREYPQNWVGEGLKNKIKGSKFGVKLIIPVDDYRKISRSVKYLLLFVSLTFLMFFLSESIAKKKIHPVQYILVGLSIVIFFVLLLSLSEHIAFITSYIVAALSTIGMISLYAYSIIKSKKFTGFIVLALSMLYIFLYILLENQDYSLLFGSLGLFLALSITMYATRNIDWYNIKYEKDAIVGDSDEKDQTDQL